MANTGEPRGRKKNCSTAERDVISNLPLNVVESILERMPFQDAVRTSVLAKRWRYMWTSMSKLGFESEFLQYLARQDLLAGFSKIVSNTLLLHDESPIVSFSVHVRFHSNVTMGDIDNWILFLSRKGIVEFTMRNLFCFPMTEYKLPSNFFTCENLTHLDLGGCVFLPPATFTGFPNLLRLQFYQVSLDEECFGNLVTNALLLETMKLKTISGILRFNITAPSLKHLEVEGDFLSIHMIAENLRRLSLKKTDRFSNSLEMEADDIIDELSRLKYIEKLYLGAGMFRFTAPRGTPTMLRNSLSCLKDVSFHQLDLQDNIHFSIAVCIMRSAPNLQQLEIRAIYRDSDVVERVTRFSLDDCMLNNLQVINLPSFHGSRSEMMLIECLLASSPHLKLMFIGVDGTVNDRMESKISKELLLFCRASPKAIIRVSNPYEEYE